MIFFEDQLQNKHIKLELNLNADLVLNVDRTILINNIFNNILSNAIIFLSTRIDKNQLFFHYQEIIVEFKDNGVGMSNEMLNNFYDNSNIQSTLGTSQEAGSGFGASLNSRVHEKIRRKR